MFGQPPPGPPSVLVRELLPPGHPVRLAITTTATPTIFSVVMAVNVPTLWSASKSWRRTVSGFRWRGVPAPMRTASAHVPRYAPVVADDDDRRIYPRIDLFAQVRVRQGSVDHVMDILNLSRGGALIDLGSTKRPRWLELRKRVDIRVFGPDGEATVDVGAQVVRILETLEQRTFAVEFAEVQDESSIRRACIAAGGPPPLPSAEKAPSERPADGPPPLPSARPYTPPSPASRESKPPKGPKPPPLPSARKGSDAGVPHAGAKPPPLPSKRTAPETSGPDTPAKPPPLPSRAR